MKIKLFHIFKYLLILSIGAASITTILYLYLPEKWVYQEQFERSGLIIREVENYRKEYTRLPNENELSLILSKYGWQLSEQCPCYQVESKSNYIVWFGNRTLGSSIVYYSLDKTWRSGG